MLSLALRWRVKCSSRVDPEVVFEAKLADGDAVKVGDVVIRIQGNARSILASERLALNFMQRMSGVATTTRKAMDVLKGTPTRVLDTRKTTLDFGPLKSGRAFGRGRQPPHGAVRHDPHQGQPRGLRGSMGAGLAGVQAYFEGGEPQVPVVVEVRSMSELNEALAASEARDLLLERLLLDNFTPAAGQGGRGPCGRSLRFEASGGIDLTTFGHTERRALTLCRWVH